ncbi:serine/threonine-protein kinase [Geodermatophilus sp. SYSU D00815]
MPAPDATKPPVVPGYTLQELLGRGGSGEVWRAVPRGGGAPVAVKVLVAGDPERQAREAALLGELDHPHLVRLHEVVHPPRRAGGSRVALVLDLLPGGSLAALLARRGRLRPGEVVTAVAPVAAALAHAHEHGVVHGDLSPGNIVFTAEGRPVLTDLGVARVLGEAAAREVTPAYVDPTVARGGAPGPASDVFGVAAAAFHALTGVPPWNAAGPADTLAVAAAGLLPDLAELAPDAPAELVAVLARGLAADPHERGTAAELALDLRHACRPEPVRLPAAGVPDDELGRTGRGPRTELTHQVPGRRRPAEVPPEPAPPGRWSRALPLLRRAGAVAGIGTLLAAAVWLGTRWGSGEDATPATPAAAAPSVSPASSSAPPPAAAAVPPGAEATDPADPRETPADPAGWVPVLAELYRRRAEAFATASADPLAGVYTDGSDLRAADAGSVAALAASGEVLRGFTPGVLRVTAARVSADRAEVDLVDAVPGYDVVRAAQPGAGPVRSEPGRPEAPVRMVLRATADGWRIESAVLLA